MRFANFAVSACLPNNGSIIDNLILKDEYCRNLVVRGYFYWFLSIVDSAGAYEKLLLLTIQMLFEALPIPDVSNYN